MAKILDFLGNIIFGDKKNNKVPITCASMDILGEIYIRELAFNLVVNKIANAISKMPDEHLHGQETRQE